jgi:hypothetical protein
VLAHESSKCRKLLFKTVEIGLSDLANQMVWFCEDRQQSGVSSGFNKGLLLRPSNIWMDERQDHGKLRS